MPTMTETGSERITLAEAFRRYDVPIATLRYWLDKGELTRDYDHLRRVVVEVVQLETKVEQWRAGRRRPT